MISRKTLANAIRILSIDAIQHANSGHPGAPMGMADIAEVLWRDYLNHNPANPLWPNRDRFVLSNGHASMLLYSILHLTGYNLSIKEIKNFRKLNSETPGHPEYNYIKGIETTTGPLGQGLANAVGFAIGERTLSAQFNREELNIIDHYTYVFLGDGCLMEGISHEACSIAGTMKLGKLIAFYDNNGISIDGDVKKWFNDDTQKRFEAYNWQVIPNINGHDSNSIKLAIEKAKSTNNKPSLIICNTTIAFGSPNKQGNSITHGSPLGEQEILATRAALNWNVKEHFVIPQKIYQHWNAKKIGQKKELNWKKKFNLYKQRYPTLANELYRRIKNILPPHWEIESQKFITYLQNNPNIIATRQASKNILEKFGPMLPELIGGSADLTPSNLTFWSNCISIKENPAGNYIHYGVREFGMTAIGNGIANYGGFLPYTATFLTFIEYARNAVRMAALMQTKHIMIYTHDSIGVGEDGPTHQPIEQLSNLRMTPNIIHWRPCDQVETAVAWKKAIENKGPTALILSRQNLKQQSRDINQLMNISKGGYILKECDKQLKLIILATGSEIELAVAAYQKLKEKGCFNVRVVSLPSTDIFDKQNKIYRESVLPRSIKARIAIEASSSDYWYKYVGLDGEIIGMKTFGKSAPAQELFNFFGFNVNNIISKSYKLLKNN